MDDLKPCPWCGSTDVVARGDDKIVAVCCNNCQAHGPNQYIGEYDWNTRAAPKIKPLVWISPSPTTDGAWQDKTGIYDIEEGILFIGHVNTGIRCGSDEKAKARAQTDYERRIREALE